MIKQRTGEMTSSGFVAYAIEVARETVSWDDAGEAFEGPARWDAPAEAHPPVCDNSDLPQPQPA
jgi:hypothetical protein